MFRLIFWPITKFVQGLVLITLILAGTALFLIIDGLNDSSVTLPGAHTDVAVILGNGVYPNLEPRPILKERLDRAIELYHLGLFPVIVVSGSNGPDDREVTAMTQYLTRAHIPAHAIIQDSDGVDTDATAKDLAKICDEHHFNSVTVISHYFHISRCKLALGHYGIHSIHQQHAGQLSFDHIFYIVRDVAAYYCYLTNYICSGTDWKKESTALHEDFHAIESKVEKIP